MINDEFLKALKSGKALHGLPCKRKSYAFAIRVDVLNWLRVKAKKYNCTISVIINDILLDTMLFKPEAIKNKAYYKKRSIGRELRHAIKIEKTKEDLKYRYRYRIKTQK